MVYSGSEKSRKKSVQRKSVVAMGKERKKKGEQREVKYRKREREREGLGGNGRRKGMSVIKARVVG